MGILVIRSLNNNMDHINVAYKPDSDAVSLGDLPSDRRYTSSPGIIPAYTQQMSDHIIGGRHLSVHKLSTIAIDQKRQNDNSLEQQVPNIEDKHVDADYDDSYYSLKRFRERRRGERDEDSTLSRRVKRFYKDQDELIDVYERVHNQAAGNETENNKHAKQQKIANILTKVSLVANLVSIVIYVFNQ